jgi:hypothetical protein
MVVYNLVCEHQHGFEGWFASLDSYEEQAQRGLLACPACGSVNVARRPSASYVKVGSALAPEDQRQVALTAQDPRLLWAKMIDLIRRNTEDVGERFTEEARKIHYQEVQPKNIRGVASSQQIAELTDEGIEVFALPGERQLPDKLQ